MKPAAALALLAGGAHGTGHRPDQALLQVLDHILASCYAPKEPGTEAGSRYRRDATRMPTDS